ncbi:MAG: SDR family oxidoreductase [Chloroflexota bacterium]
MDISGTLASLIETAHRIGADRKLVLYGGGNISAKTAELDHLGRERPVLVIKGSGADMRTIEAGGFSRLYLDDLLTLRSRDQMSDAEMTAFFMRALVDPRSGRPSIETLLHAFRPSTFVYHVHADAICALTNASEGAWRVAEALGADIPVLPYVRPGFDLAKEVSEIEGDAAVLSHHGLVTWSDDPRACMERTLELTNRAETFLRERKGEKGIRGPAVAPLDHDQTERLLLTLRRRLSRKGNRILALEPHGRPISDRPDVDRVASAGPATADHLLRTRPWTAVIRTADEVDAVIDGLERQYDDFVSRHSDRIPPDTGRRDATPAVVLVPGLGLIAAGIDARSARSTAEVAMHTHGVAADVLDAFGEVESLPERDIFDIEYWPLELAKLRPTPASDLAGRVVIVTGGGSGIGRDTAVALARAGAHLAVCDRDAVGLDGAAEQIREVGHDPVVVTGDISEPDVVDRLVRETILEFGGVDGLVSNAGVAVAGRLVDLALVDWERSLAVNATSHFLLVRRILPVLERQGLGGSLVFVASKNAFSPGEGFGAYSVAKAAEVQLARMVAIEAGRSGVRANVVSPDAVFEGSKLWDETLRAERAKAHGVPVDQLERFYADRSLLGRAVRTSDVAEAVAFCLSDRSSRMTGCVITVDAGVAAAFPR